MIDQSTVRYAGANLPIGHYNYRNTNLYLESSDVEIRRSVVSYSGRNGIEVRYESTPILTSNLLSKNQYGVYVSNSAKELILFTNTFSKNSSYGIYNQGQAQVDARNNAWDHPSGPTHGDNPDGIGDRVSNNVLYNPWTGMLDRDNDGIADGADNCVDDLNTNQHDQDADGIGDICDNDRDGDGVYNQSDPFPDDPNEFVDTDGDNIGDEADLDDDGDGVPDIVDNCPLLANPRQLDDDTDGIGNECDPTDDTPVPAVPTDPLQRVSISSTDIEADDASGAAMVSASGRFITFESEATNLVSNDSNTVKDIFIRDVELGLTTRASISTSGTEADDQSFSSDISDNGV
ncbi:MAG: hypothetical protein GY703_16575, partial [Gammaproteobacteria bacterium]|nr:hypothetical protein [Gammaproteobacteria bacterium]